MKTNFLEYYNKRKNIDSLFESIVLEAKNNQDLYDLLDEAGFWGNLVNAGKQMFQGVQQGAQAAWSQMTGPATQFGNAIGALEKAANQLANDPNWSKSTTTGGGKYPAMNLVQWLKDTVQELKGQQSQLANKQMPANIPTQSAQPNIDPSTGKPFQVSPDGTGKNV